jgi:hypothetical protein
MKFKSRKDILFQLLGFSIIVFFIGIILFRVFSDGIENYNFMWTDIFMLTVAGFLIWLGLGTNYELTQTELKYKSGPIRGKIEIDKIHEIIKGKTLWSGLKPATARNGLIIKYEKYNEIYISPKTNDSFMKKILELNDKIKITPE